MESDILMFKKNASYKKQVCKNNKKNYIETCILPFIPKTKHIFPPKVDLNEIVQCMFYIN